MNKLFVILFVKLLIPVISVSQGFNGGLLAGMTATQVDGDGYGGYNRAGLIGGVWIDRNFSPEITIRTELKYIQKGSYRRFKDETGGTIGFYSLRLNYIEMPLLIEYHFREDITPFAGLSFGFLWKALEKNADGPYDNEFVDKFRKLEIAGNAGVTYNVNTSFSICVVYSYSAFPVRPHKEGITYHWDRGQFNNVLQFYLRFHL